MSSQRFFDLLAMPQDSIPEDGMLQRIIHS